MTDLPNREPNGQTVLDLCCKAGGISMGWWRKGFNVVGIDKDPQPNYPFEFVQADALEYLTKLTRSGEIERYAAVLASWPCQHFARVTAWRGNRNDHPDLLTPGRELMRACGRPWVIENVPEAPMRPDYLLCGSMFGLNVRRHRVFETSWGGGDMVPPCWHHRGLIPFGHKNERAFADAMGCTWMTNREAREAIPPAYAEYLAGQFLSRHPIPAAA